MKKTILLARKMMGIFVLLGTFTLLNEVKAQTFTNPLAELRYVGEEEEQPVFMLHIANPDEDIITYTFRFNNGDILYVDKVKAAEFARRFRMNIENLEDADLRLEVKSKKTGKVEVFEIRKSMKYLNHTYVNKVQ